MDRLSLLRGSLMTDIFPSPFVWIDIPASANLPAYSIAKYPVTNAQFALFIEAGGYHERKWWTNAGWENCEKGFAWTKDQKDWEPSGHPWTEPLYWKEDAWNGEAHPVVGISWFEAVAFCLWFSDYTHSNIMLPTETQWRFAAQGYDGRVYPWGNQWELRRCNSSTSTYRSTGTTPVQRYQGSDGNPCGESPFGVVDMAGNVYEWCLTNDEKRTNDVDGFAFRRVTYGGSWASRGDGTCRTDYPSSLLPNYRWNQTGFRISRST
jgi:formylglycine-generating enzyme required for sulfatase activity